MSFCSDLCECTVTIQLVKYDALMPQVKFIIVYIICERNIYI